MVDRARDESKSRSDDATRATAQPAQGAANGTHRAALDAAANVVVRQMIATRGRDAGASAPAAHHITSAAGKDLGVALGVIVTEALAAVPSWNQPVLDAAGKPVESVAGAERIGDHDILKRHEEVVGPKIAAVVDKIPAGQIHDFVAGVGAGATEAPGDSYRLEAAISDLVRRHLPK